MKPTSTLLIVLLLVTGIFLQRQAYAQVPEKMSYQAVIRNSSDQLVTNTNIGMQISILQDSNTGTAVYVERHYPSTNANGLVSIEIGGSTIVSGSFALIDWASGTYFVKTETDLNGDANYTITGTSQILSVPYALHAKEAENGFSGDYNDLTNLPTLNIPNWNMAYSWGDHNGLYLPISYVPAWADITGKPIFATVATSGNYNDLLNKPILFDGAWTSLTGKPTFSTVATSGTFADLLSKPASLAGYGITDAMSTSHAANGITNTNITNWNTAYSWGNHSGLYRSISYVPVWTEITSKPTTLSGYGITDAVNTTGAQTIRGNKTFSGTTTVSTPVNATDAVNKAYVDQLISRIEALELILGNDTLFDQRDNHYYKCIKI
jgi:hypothetical protein